MEYKNLAMANDFLPLTVQAMESWVEVNCCVTAVKSPPMVKHREGEISEAPVSELYSSRMLKQCEDSLQYPLSKLRNVWNSYAGLMQNRISEFYIVLLSTVFVYLFGVGDQRNPEQELGIQIIHENKKAEVNG